MATKRRFIVTIPPLTAIQDVTPGDLRSSPVDGFIQLAATGEVGNLLEISMSIQSINVFLDGVVSVERIAGQGPIIPDNVLITEVITMLQTLNLAVRNNDVVPRTIFIDAEYLS